MHDNTDGKTVGVNWKISLMDVIDKKQAVKF